MTDKKKILIVSYLFAPQNVIGAIRATKLAKYLSRMGHEVTVVCGEGVTSLCDPMLERDLAELTDVHIIREWNPVRDRKQKAETEVAPSAGNSVAPRPSKASLKGRILDQIYLLLRFLADVSFARLGIRGIRQMNREFDVVLTSYGPWSSHWIGKAVKKQGLASRWIADFRDVVAPPFFRGEGWVRNYLRNVKNNADQITGVSAGYLDMMGLVSIGTVITNGFDREDLQGMEPAQPIKDAVGEKHSLCFVYCGQMYGAQRDLRPFFRAVSELAQEGCLDKAKLLLVHAGHAQDAAIFKAQAAEFGLGDQVEAKGLLSRDQAIGLQLSADGILIATWNTPELLGNLPGKLLEVLMLGRPVICCAAGQIPDSEAARVICETRVGCCYEEAAGEESYQALKSYVKSLCEAPRGENPHQADAQAVEQYEYEQVARRFDNLL